MDENRVRMEIFFKKKKEKGKIRRRENYMSEYIANQYQRDDMNPGAVLYMAHIHGETDTGRSKFYGLHTQFSEIIYNIN